MKNKKFFHEKIEPIIAIIVLCCLLVGFGVISENNKQEEIKIEHQIEE